MCCGRLSTSFVCILLTSSRINAKLLIRTLVLPLNDAFYFNSWFFQDSIHFLRERMAFAQKFEGEITSFLVGEKWRLELFQIFILNGDIMKSNDHHRLARLVWTWFSLLRRLGFFREWKQFILDQDERFHGMVQRQVMLVELTQNSTDVQMNLAWVWDA